MRASFVLSVVMLCAAKVCVEGAAPPFISFLQPEHGDDAGGAKVFIVGRNLGFLNEDVKVFVNYKKAEVVDVEVGWERIRVTMPPCPRCGVVPVSIKVGEEMSNRMNFTYLNDCEGPVLPPARPLIPKQFSAKENCSVCVEVVALAQAVAPDQATYQAFKEAMHGTCDTVHFRKYNMPGSKCQTDWKVACKILVHTMSEAILDAIWALWNEFYWRGMLPDAVCQVIKRCDRNKAEE